MNALVFGGTGQIGYELLLFLRPLGYSIINASRSETSSHEDSNVYIDLSKSSISDVISLCHLCKPAVIIYLAAIHGSSVCHLMTESFASSIMKHVNYFIPLALLDYCSSHSCKFVHASSSYVYSPISNAIRFVDESTFPSPVNQYGSFKAQVQESLLSLVEQGVNALNLVFFNNISDRRRPPFLIPTIIDHVIKIKTGSLSEASRVLELKSATSLFDLSLTSEVAYLSAALIHHDVSGNFILGSGNVISVSDLVEACFAACGLNSVHHVSYCAVDVFDQCCVAANNSRATSIVGDYRLSHPLEIISLLMKNACIHKGAPG
jgi:nucleoside-diphosphate-sugar epimerase